jgi:hypothetical protein
MSQSLKSLSLTIATEGKTLSFVLSPGKTIFVGRDPACELQIPLDSISTQHLAIEWDGEKLKVRDLESSNGTYRMPQDSPFLEVLLDPKEAELELRLAKVSVQLSFEKIDGTEVLSEKTEVLSPKDKEPVLAVGVKQAPQPPVAVAPKSPAKIQAKTKNQKQSKPQTKSSHENLGVGTLLLAGLGVFLLHSAYVLFKYATFLEVGLDAYLLWWDDRMFLGGLSLLGLILFFVLKNKISFWDSISTSRRKILGFAGIMSFLLPLLWPLYFLSAYENPVSRFQATQVYHQIKNQIAQHDFSNKKSNLEISARLTELAEPLQGSSVYYTFWHNFQKQRVVKECGGLGEASWDKKRFCLVLLFALALESFSEIQPHFLNRTASHLVLLTSLDGIVRVLAAEGPQSENLKIFLNALDNVGLDEEVSALVVFVQTFRGQRFEDLMRGLLEVRVRLENEVNIGQRRAQLPQQMRLNLLGPLEMGI